ncbi:hypothetical protein QAD02_018294 [Eretmocerus hayati]|uniref:Uncharacterized protein n=1 Tax=Eretmocerus hayati TaxID=131215 RepID=A0ACC2PGB1_9HYME|nr:hypothetical protein QAD02_018294 [Eretmocerus hayati]
MHIFFIIALRVPFFALFNALSETDVKFSLPWYGRPAMKYTARTEKKCHEETTTVIEHPYYVSIISKCYEEVNESSIPVTTQRFGLIISSYYILTHLDESMYTETGCENIVTVLADNSTFEAKLLKKYLFALYKVQTPMELHTKARPVEIVNAHDEPKPGDDVTIVGLNYDSSNGDFGVIQLKNVTVIGDENTKVILSTIRYKIPYSTRDQFLWFDHSDYSCYYNVFFTSMFLGDRLVGIEGTAVFKNRLDEIQGLHSLSSCVSPPNKLFNHYENYHKTPRTQENISKSLFISVHPELSPSSKKFKLLLSTTSSSKFKEYKFSLPCATISTSYKKEHSISQADNLKIS